MGYSACKTTRTVLPSGIFLLLGLTCLGAATLAIADGEVFEGPQSNADLDIVTALELGDGLPLQPRIRSRRPRGLLLLGTGQDTANISANTTNASNHSNQTAANCYALVAGVQQRLNFATDDGTGVRGDNYSCIELVEQIYSQDLNVQEICASSCLDALIFNELSDLVAQGCFANLVPVAPYIDATCRPSGCDAPTGLACVSSWLVSGCPDAEPLDMCKPYEGCTYPNEVAQQCPEEWDRQSAVVLTLSVEGIPAPILRLSHNADALRSAVADAAQLNKERVRVVRLRDNLNTSAPNNTVGVALSLSGESDTALDKAAQRLAAAVSSKDLVDAVNDELAGSKHLISTSGAVLVKITDNGGETAAFERLEAFEGSVVATAAEPKPTPSAPTGVCDPFEHCLVADDFCDYVEGDRGRCRSCSTVPLPAEQGCVSAELALEKSGRIHCKQVCAPTPMPSPVVLPVFINVPADIDCTEQAADDCIDGWIKGGCGTVVAACGRYLACLHKAASLGMCSGVVQHPQEIRLPPLGEPTPVPTPIGQVAPPTATRTPFVLEPRPEATPTPMLPIPLPIVTIPFPAECRRETAKSCVDDWTLHECPDNPPAECDVHLLCLAVAAQRGLCSTRQYMDLRLPPLPPAEAIPTPIPEPMPLTSRKLIVPANLDCSSDAAKRCVDKWIDLSCPATRAELCIEYLICFAVAAQRNRCGERRKLSEVLLPPIPNPIFEEGTVDDAPTERNSTRPNATPVPIATPIPEPVPLPADPVYIPPHVDCDDAVAHDCINAWIYYGCPISKVPTCIDKLVCLIRVAQNGRCITNFNNLRLPPISAKDMPPAAPTEEPSMTVIPSNTPITSTPEPTPAPTRPTPSANPFVFTYPPAVEGSDPARVAKCLNFTANCSGHGACVRQPFPPPGLDGTCSCDPGYGVAPWSFKRVDDCSLAINDMCLNKCFGHGICNLTSAPPPSSFAQPERNFTCNCFDGYGGVSCDRWARCDFLDFCSGHGTCTRSSGEGAAPARCECLPGYWGEMCENMNEVGCRDQCSGRGTCLLGAVQYERKCACVPGFRGVACGRVDEKACPASCSGLGSCVLPEAYRNSSAPANVSRVCRCRSGFAGDDCSEIVDMCSHFPCLHGYCRGGTCECIAPYSGRQCNVYNATLDEPCVALNHCSGFGVCVKSNMTGTASCKCFDGFSGPRCDRTDANYDDECPNHCSGHGRCALIKKPHCVCDSTHTGSDCSVSLCGKRFNGKVCSGHGICELGLEGTPSCTCDSGYKSGAFGECEVERCPNSCSERGQCMFDGSCVCDDGYIGDDCSMLSPLQPKTSSSLSLKQQRPGDEASKSSLSASVWDGLEKGSEERRRHDALQKAADDSEERRHAIVRADDQGTAEEESEGEVQWEKNEIDADDVDLMPCPNACSHRGRCLKGGICACYEGRGGKDCSIILPDLDDMTDQIDLDTVGLVEI